MNRLPRITVVQCPQLLSCHGNLEATAPKLSAVHHGTVGFFPNRWPFPSNVNRKIKNAAAETTSNIPSSIPDEMTLELASNCVINNILIASCTDA